MEIKMAINKGYLTAKTDKQSDETFTPREAILPLLKYIDKNLTIWCPFDLEDSEYVKVFKENGYETIRIKDKELKERNGFLRCLLNGLMTISISNNTANIEAMIKELSNITN